MNMTIEKRKLLEEPVVIEFEDEEDDEDLSWMINNDEKTESELNNKKQKHKK